MTVSMRIAFLAAASCAVTAWGQSNTREPHIGYVYPAGGQRGESFEIVIGGQNLRGARDVHVSGTGVRGTVIQHYRPIFNLQKEQRDAIQNRLRECIQSRLAESSQHNRFISPSSRKSAALGEPSSRSATARSQPTTNVEADGLPEHPLLRNLESKSLRELLHVRSELLGSKRKQPNAQIAESVLIRVVIDAHAKPGDREIRLETPQGLTNPMCFQVGLLPEIRELEVHELPPNIPVPEEPPLSLPVLINGQIKPGDVDRFRFVARRGQRLVIETSARHLIPYLADAVPGWFQATLGLYDARGREVAFADDYRFNPDPVLFYEVPADGQYELEIRDSLYRGREDFVYRIVVGEQPFVTRTFPLGGRAGAGTVASVDGWNLPSTRLAMDTTPGAGAVRQTELRDKEGVSNRVAYGVGVLPEENETESNDTVQSAERISLPRVINGRISQSGDVDVFRFEGRAGSDVVAEVWARRLLSPLDSLLRLTDESGRVLAWNDDHEDMETGLLTHHADSYLRTRLPENGVYYVHLSDSQHHGGEAYGYRLRISPPRPDFALRMTPSSLNIRAGSAAPICLYAVRKDGFGGDIEVIVKDAPAGFTLSGGRIPKGCDRVRMTLAASRATSDRPVMLELEGRAWIDGTLVRRPVVPSEDMMQAFIYRHLVPSRNLMVAVRGASRRGPVARVIDDRAIRLPLGGTAKVTVKTSKFPLLQNVTFELSEPPTGVTLDRVTMVPDGLTLTLKADVKSAKAGLADNLIVEAFAEAPGGAPQKAKERNQRISLGVLPAIPFEITRR